MEQCLGKVAIVTGASCGIGADIAEALVRAGIKVVGVARRVEKIQNLAATLTGHEGVLHPMECDVTKEEDILRVFDWTEKNLGGVDILVNNAAVLIPGRIIDGSTEDYRKIMEVNVIAVAIFTREAVNSMRKHKIPGHIININSVAGHDAKIISIPANLYSASKYAVTAISHSVRMELATVKMNVKVTSISPGAVKTDMLNNLGIPPETLERLPKLAGKDIADAVIYVLTTPPHVQVDEVTVTPVATGVKLAQLPVSAKSQAE